MNPKCVMLIAGDPSGDANAADLVRALTRRLGGCSFFGAGGPRMKEAGVELEYDLTADSIIGITDAIKKYPLLRKRFNRLAQLALERKPELIVLVDFAGFNLRFAQAIRNASGDWRPKIVQYVSPQVWATRPGRADKLAQNYDLLLCLFQFEKEWYAKRVPQFRVEFVGHPLFDRLPARTTNTESAMPNILLLPGSRTGELKKHLPVMLAAAKAIATQKTVRFKMVLPNESLAAQARPFDLAAVPNLEIQVGGLAEEMARTTLVISKTGTVMLECAYFGLPTLAIYKTSWLTYWIARMIIQVKYIAMPNILADEEVFPEFIQGDATPENITRAMVELLDNPAKRAEVKAKLAIIVASLGGPGAGERAAAAILTLSNERSSILEP